MAKELVGWKEIADRLGVTVRAAQRYAALEQDPLPCYRRMHSARLDVEQLEAWLDRHREPIGDVEPASVVLVATDARLAPIVRLFHRAALRVLERAGAADARARDPRQVTVDEHLERIEHAQDGQPSGAPEARGDR